jgi:isoquinoline 1-oxidoreductase beta subunit
MSTTTITKLKPEPPKVIAPNLIDNFSRRGFLGAAGGLILGFVLPSKSAAQQVGIPPPTIFAPPPTGKPMAYIHIAPDDSITFWITKSEMGQGPTTACSQMLAEELECDWSKVRVQVAPVDPASFGHQTTVGSQAIRTTWVPLRTAGAQAREMLTQAAAQRWNVNTSQCRAENGFVINTSTNAKLSYGSLAEDAAKVPVPANVKLKDAKDYKIIGKPVKRLDTRAKVTGQAQFGLDARVDGMLYAVVAHCPVFGGKVVSFDATKTKAVAGVKDVVQTSRGVAVVADNTWAAMQGMKVLTVQWDEGAGANVSSASIRQMFVDRTKETGGIARKEGDAAAGLAKAAKKIDAVYEVPYLAHAPMEPMNCTVHAKGDSVEAWIPTQSPTTARAVIAQALGIAPEKVNVHVTFIGGGFGRRGEGELDFVLDAAEVAKQVKAPVKAAWSREEDMQHDYYRPASYVELSGGVDADGWPSVLQAKIACPSFGQIRDGVDSTGVSGIANIAYSMPDILVDWREAKTIVPVSYWRAPGNNQNVYFLECFFDELCALGGKDPLEARRHLLTQNPRNARALNVLNIAAEKAGYGKKLPAGHFHGVALHPGALNAQIAEISIAKGKVKVHKVVCAFDCGQVINPGILRQQAEGAIVFGLAAATKGEITLEKGRVVQGNFNTYDVTRMDESPAIEVYIVPSTESPVGAGESCNPTILPAVVNAIYAATKKRIRKLPIRTMNLA